ncbi:hypothetical protein DFH09DRAFT_1326850 [Mycena vulgaris]|nr:hypothetical protein DFH09DRAFT_1326850 [Mycena vulgaris]
MDRRSAGICPRLGPRTATIKLKQERNAHVEELQRLREQQERTTRVEELQRRRDAPRKRVSPEKGVLDISTLRPLPPVSSAPAGPLRKRVKSTLKPELKTPKLHTNRGEYRDDEETTAIAQRMLEKFQADGVDPLEDMLQPSDDMSSEEEYDPNCGLPYCPRLKVDRRRLHAVCMISGTLAQLEAERLAAEQKAKDRFYAMRSVPVVHAEAMKRVAAQIEQRSMDS